MAARDASPGAGSAAADDAAAAAAAAAAGPAAAANGGDGDDMATQLMRRLVTMERNMSTLQRESEELRARQAAEREQ